MIPTFKQAKKQHDVSMNKIQFLINQLEENRFYNRSSDDLAGEIARLLEKIDELEKYYPVLRF